MLSNNVAKFVKANHLLRPDGKYVVALSGGADSVCLTLVLLDLGYHIEAAHCNFHLRGSESDRDEKFCRDFCKRVGIRLHVVDFDTRKYAEAHKVSIEMAARDLRYDYFERLRKETGADDICVAHHREDSVETVLLNLTRGTGIQGLTGIQPRRGHIVRPLLCAGRDEIEDYLAQKHQPFVTDSTNLETDALRNKVRLNVIPLLKEINPRAVENIYKSSQYLLAAQKTAFYAVKDGLLDGKRLLFTRLKAVFSPEFAIWFVFKDMHFSSSQIEEMSQSVGGQPGKEWRSATHVVVTDSEGFAFDSIENLRPTSIEIAGNGAYNIPLRNEKIEVSVVENTPDLTVSRDRCTAMLDADSVKMPITIRSWRQGDRFVPFGMKGSKLVSDMLTNLKMNLLQKRRQLVAVDSSGKIIWLVGVRPDNRCRITPSTRRITVLKHHTAGALQRTCGEC